MRYYFMSLTGFIIGILLGMFLWSLEANATGHEMPKKLPQSIEECETDLECYGAAKVLCDEGENYWCWVITLGPYAPIDEEKEK